jgi:hypothetical protein
MEKIPTAKKVYYAVTGCVLESHHNPDIEKAMIEFAKLHIEAALKEASETADLTDNGRFPYVDKDSILNSYSLDNIK